MTLTLLIELRCDMRKRCGLVVLWLTLLAQTVQAQSIGCGGATLSSGTYTLADQGLTRTFRLHVPWSYDAHEPAPLILAFHGWGGTEDTLLDYRVIRRAANRMGAIIAAPSGLGANESRPNSWTALGTDTGIGGDSQAICNPAVLEDETYPSCAGTAQNLCSWTQCQTDDIAFTDALITHLEDTLCIDQTRIYAAGTSNGGLFTWGLAQDLTVAPRLAAIAPIIGLPHRGHATTPAANLPTLLISGIDDPIVPPGNWEDTSFTTSRDGEEFFYTSAAAITQAYATARGCSIDTPAQSIDVGVNRLDCRSYCAPTEGAPFPPLLDCRMTTGHDADLRTTWPLVMQFFSVHAKDTP